MEITIDTIQKELTQIVDKKERIRFIQNKIWPVIEPFPNVDILNKGSYLIDEAFSLAKEIQDKWGIGMGYVNKGFVGLYISQDMEAIKNFHEGLAIFKEINDESAFGRTLNVMAYSLWMMGRYDEALDYAFRSLKHAEEIGEFTPLGWTHYALGVFYFDLKDYEESEYYYRKAYDIFSKTTNPTFPQARCRSGIGSVMIATKRYDEALEEVNLSAEGFRATNNTMGESRALNDLGLIYRTQGKFTEAEHHFTKALEIRVKSNYLPGISTSYIDLGALYIELKQFNRALEALSNALIFAEKTKSKPKLYQIHDLFGEVYKQLNNPAKALEHKELFFKLKTEVTGEQASNRLKNLQTQYATEKSDKEAEIHRLKNVELKKAYAEIEEKNKNILDSINYAKRIQQAILPSDAEINKTLPHSFVLYMPKDVVSGDFYWVEQKNDTTLFAAIDCTGHGVPGAFMSMIGNTLLNEIVNDKGITTPGLILSHLREGIIKALKQTGHEGENQDGMDIALCALKNNVLEFSGANNPLWYVRNGELHEIKADKQPIGIYYGTPKPFTNHCLEVNKNDCIYIFTDGYADQIGGPNQKKFKYKALEDLILKAHQLPMPEQKEIFKTVITEWKGNLEQIDDILIIGIKIQ